MARKGNPWLRFDVQTYSDAKIRLGRCGAVWPWILSAIKRCGGSVTDEDLSPDLAALDLCITPEQATEQIAGAKRVGLLVLNDGEWSVPHWDDYQPDPRKRWGSRSSASQGVPGTDRMSQDDPSGSKSIRPHPTDGTRLDGTRLDETGRDETKQTARAVKGQAVEDEVKPMPDPDADSLAVAAVLARLDADEYAGRPEAWRRLVDAIAARGAHLTQRATVELTTMLASQPTAVTLHVAAMVAKGAEVIRSPAALVRSLLPAAVEAADTERREREAQARRDDSTQKWLAQREQAALRMQDPEAQARARALWGEIGAVLDGHGGE